MNAKTDFEKLSAIVPHRYQIEAFELLRPYLGLEMTREIDKYLATFKVEPMAPNEIVKIVFKLVGDVTGVINVRETKVRTHSEVTARQLAMYALYYEIPNFSLGKVGACFQHKFDHATVLNAHKSIEAFYMTHGEFRRLINQLADLMSELNLNNLKNRLAILKTL